jgi:putative Mg2+ transporter-C (MgtC) family protein
MPTNLVWSDIAIRLLCTIVAGGAIGFNRGEHGRAAGLRTMILVALAACLAMIEANYMLSTVGKTAGSFSVMDTLRFPLGILSGIGFIGAGAIVRRDNFVVGVTTAATIWFVTMIGLCFGGGQIALGAVGAAIGIVTLTVLKALEDRIKQDHLGKLSVVTDPSGPGEDEIRASLAQAGVEIDTCAFAYSPQAESREMNCDLRWRAAMHDAHVPEVIHALAGRPGVIRIAWTPQAR